MKYCMDDKDFYYEMIREFASSSTDTANALEEFYKAGNWNDYRIKVHALKSNARSIGAVTLSEQALALETAAKENNIETITAEHSSFISSCRALAEALGRI